MRTGSPERIGKCAASSPFSNRSFSFLSSSFLFLHPQHSSHVNWATKTFLLMSLLTLSAFSSLTFHHLDPCCYSGFFFYFSYFIYFPLYLLFLNGWEPEINRRGEQQLHSVVCTVCRRDPLMESNHIKTRQAPVCRASVSFCGVCV